MTGKRNTNRSLLLAVAALTLVSQVAVVAHSPVLHREEAVKGRDTSKHFCPETSSTESHRCVLCQASLGGVDSIVPTHSASFQLAQMHAVPDLAGPRSLFKFTPASPRGPPAL